MRHGTQVLNVKLVYRSDVNSSRYADSEYRAPWGGDGERGETRHLRCARRPRPTLVPTLPQDTRRVFVVMSSKLTPLLGMEYIPPALGGRSTMYVEA